MSAIKAEPVAPKFRIGQKVAYFDRQGRRQEGLVRAISAEWGGYRRDGSCNVGLTVTHPTYLNNRIYIGEEHVWASS